MCSDCSADQHGQKPPDVGPMVGFHQIIVDLERVGHCGDYVDSGVSAKGRTYVLRSG